MKCFLITFMLLFSIQSFSQDIVKSQDGKKEYHTGYLGDSGEHGQLYFTPAKKKGFVAPASLDLRTSGLVSKIKDQGQCGSCWSFAITKALESAMLKAGKSELDLSEQQLVACETKAAGCNGGYMESAYYAVNPGLTSESNWPYTATDSPCKNPLPSIAAKGVNWAFIGSSSRAPTVDELKEAIATYGVIFVTVSAGGNDWGGSVTHMTGCLNAQVNHMVTLVGYNEKNEFIIGNSWGTSWGEKGYAYAKQGCNKLASTVRSAAFITVDGNVPPTPPPGPTPPPTPPGPGPAPIRLPSIIWANPGTQIPIGVLGQSRTTYQWSRDGKVVGTTPLLWSTMNKDTVYTLRATNINGVTESSLEIKMNQVGKK